MKRLFALLACLCLVPFVTAKEPSAGKAGENAVMSAVKTGESIVIESKGDISYKVTVDTAMGGTLSKASLPAGVEPNIEILGGIFFYGEHGEQLTLRGWTKSDRCIQSCSVKIVSQKPGEIVVQADIAATGTFKILEKDRALSSQLRAKYLSYQQKTVQIRRMYTFKPDRILLNDRIVWVHPDTEIRSVYVSNRFPSRDIQSPVRMVKGTVKAGFGLPGSGGEKIPEGITYPFTAENFFKSGYKLSTLTTEASFDMGDSDFYFYEKPWQQDWGQESGFMYRIMGYPKKKPVVIKNEIVFSKAGKDEMPPVITINSPSWDQRYKDEVNEVVAYKVGETLNLSASAVNSDGSAVPDSDISWEIHINPYWKTPSTVHQGAKISYVIPAPDNDEDRKSVEERGGQMLAVIKVKAKGNNGTESFEPFAMLVGKYVSREDN